jgi:redox-sensitive bicupin YhaK (pirin superfamily)
MTTKVKTIASETIRMGNLLTRQPLPVGKLDYLDPFLLLHHTGPFTFPPANAGLPFAPHPHKGFETVTFIFDGAVEHRDSTGEESIIRTGGVQWMTAGKGIVHSENLPYDMREHGGKVEYIQLWVNLPAKYKGVKAKYQGFQSADIPKVRFGEAGSSLAVYSGAFGETRGPVDSITGVSAFVLDLKANDQFRYSIVSGKEILLYQLSGKAKVLDVETEAYEIVQLVDKASELHISALTDSRFLLCIADPIGEPVVSHGPFVMNTETEILEAMRDYQMGKMGILFN